MRFSDYVSDYRGGASIVVGAVVYARSCHAARELGPSAVDKGAVAFIGYRREFVIVHSLVDVSHPLDALVDVSHPLDDSLARMFIEPSNLVPLSLLKGNTVKDAFRKSQEAMRRTLRFMLSSAATYEQRVTASFLWGNITAQVVVGDESATA